MSVIRIASCYYAPLQDTFVMSVDIVHGAEESDLDRTYLVVAPRRAVQTKDGLRSFIESEIQSQQKALPDWSGISWKSSIE